jgi:peptidoglycan hydrolase-like protein with peptidoglycan-binding domain
MRLGPLVLLSSLLLGTTLPAVALTHTRRGPTSPRLNRRVAKSRTPSQRAIDDERATQIQSALIRSGYLTGAPSGHWDAETQAAMEKLQADNGWQTKIVPDSRAIIKLGLGPSTASGNTAASQAAAPAASQSNTFSR